MATEEDVPRYLLTAPFLSNPPHRHGPLPQFFERGLVIEHDGVPNASMEPMNAAARERVAAERGR